MVSFKEKINRMTELKQVKLAFTASLTQNQLPLKWVFVRSKEDILP